MSDKSAYLAWSVVRHGQTVRFVAAPNQPTAHSMLKSGETLCGPGRNVRRVPNRYPIDYYTSDSEKTNR